MLRRYTTKEEEVCKIPEDWVVVELQLASTLLRKAFDVQLQLAGRMKVTNRLYHQLVMMYRTLGEYTAISEIDEITGLDSSEVREFSNEIWM